MFKCKYCNREFEKLTVLAGHISYCKENPNKKKELKKLGKMLVKK